MGNAARSISLISMCLISICCTGAAFAQSPSANLRPVHDTSWVDIDVAEELSMINAGLHILAQNVGDISPNNVALGRHRDGIGAAGAHASAPAVKAETGFDPVQNRSEQIIILFDQQVTRADVDVTYFYRGELTHAGIVYHERGGWRAYHGKRAIGQGLFLPETEGGTHRIVIKTRESFDRLEMFATSYVTDRGLEIEPGLITTDSSDFLIKRVAYRPLRQAHASSPAAAH